MFTAVKLAKCIKNLYNTTSMHNYSQRFIKLDSNDNYYLSS